MTSRGTKYWNSGAIPLIAPELLGDIIATASDIAVVISDVGKILSVLVNPNHAAHGALDHWEGRDIREVLTVESIPKLEAKLDAYSTGEAEQRPVELNHADESLWEFPVRYTFHAIGPDGVLLMLGRDLRPIAEMQRQLVQAQMALERDYEAQREYDIRYRVLMETTRDAMLFVNMATGRIADLNPAAGGLIGGTRDALSGVPLAQEVEAAGPGDLLEALANAALSDGNAPLEVRARRTRKRILVTPTVFRAAGEKLLLTRLEGAEAGESVGDELSENLSALYQDGPDAIVFTDRQGVIRSANESFLDLVDLAHASQVKGRALSDFFGRGAVDLKVLIENAARTGQMRLYATRIAGEHGSDVPVEVSAAYLNDTTHPAIAFVLRDASRVDSVRTTGIGGQEDGMKSVMELVGSATLKDIVAQTTDVVEKMCIETAVELTSNNRVAAAEMLGLSRQSLYVKLRKYGLLSRDGDD